MKKDPQGLPERGFSHFLFLGLMPAGVHLFFTVIIALDVDSSGMMLIMSIMAAGAVGAILSKKKYGPIESALAAAWPSVLFAWRRWHWTLDMPSPGGAAQSLVRALGWSDASVPAAVAVLLIPVGAAGWGLRDFNRWYEKKTGRPFFEES